jgi:hypothetical protein
MARLAAVRSALVGILSRGKLWRVVGQAVVGHARDGITVGYCRKVKSPRQEKSNGRINGKWNQR